MKYLYLRKRKENKMDDILNKKIICQSCGMPMKKEDDFGTEKDKGPSQDYCTFCYRGGRFTDEGITLQDKIEKLVRISVVNLGMTETQARTLAETQLPGLKRWKKQA
jgi:hypothetical protein